MLLRDGRLTLPGLSLEDHQRLSLLEVAVKQEGCGTEPSFITQVVRAETGLTPRCYFEHWVTRAESDFAGCGGGGTD